MLSSVLGVSSNNLFITWVIIELNMFIFIRLLVSSYIRRREIIKYFIIQGVASSIFLLLIMLRGTQSIFLGSYLLLLCIVIKLGVAPFHVWFIKFMERANWAGIILVSTIQKVIPLYVLGTIGVSPTVFVISRVITAVLGSVGQNALKKVLAYSSVFGLGWLLAISSFFPLIFIFLVGYGLALLSVVIRSWAMKNPAISNLNNQQESTSEKIGIILGLLRMGGFPPLLGFILKLMAIYFLIGGFPHTVSVLLIQSSIFILFMYTRTCLQGFLGKSGTSPQGSFRGRSRYGVRSRLLVLPIVLSII